MAEKFRVREPGKYALLNPETGLHECPGLDDRYAPHHPLVKAHPWAFATDVELAAKVAEDRSVTAVRIADAEPVEFAVEVPTPGRRGGRRA